MERGGIRAYFCRDPFTITENIIFRRNSHTGKSCYQYGNDSALSMADSGRDKGRVGREAGTICRIDIWAAIYMHL